MEKENEPEVPGEEPDVVDPTEEVPVSHSVEIYERIKNLKLDDAIAQVMADCGYTFLFREDMIDHRDYETQNLIFDWYYSYILKEGENVLVVSETFGDYDACLLDFKNWVKEGNLDDVPEQDPDAEHPAKSLYEMIKDEDDYEKIIIAFSLRDYVLIFHKDVTSSKEYGEDMCMPICKYVVKTRSKILRLSQEFGTYEACLADLKQWTKENL